MHDKQENVHIVRLYVYYLTFIYILLKTQAVNKPYSPMYLDIRLNKITQCPASKCNCVFVLKSAKAILCIAVPCNTTMHFTFFHIDYHVIKFTVHV